MGQITFASFEEEARPKLCSTAKFLRYCPCDCRLSSPSHTVKPEDATLLCAVGPCLDALQYLDTRVSEAQRIVLMMR